VQILTNPFANEAMHIFIPRFKVPIEVTGISASILKLFAAVKADFPSTLKKIKYPVEVPHTNVLVHSSKVRAVIGLLSLV